MRQKNDVFVQPGQMVELRVAYGVIHFFNTTGKPAIVRLHGRGLNVYSSVRRRAKAPNITTHIMKG
jgi:hypothetical protein